MSRNDKDSIEDRVIETANRLRLVQADLADESGRIRRDQLSDELAKVLAAVSSDEHDEFMRRLLEQLLAGDFSARSETEAQEAGLSPGNGQAGSIDLFQELRKQLQVTGDLNLSREEHVELTTMLVDFVLKLDPLVWNTWRALSPRSGIRAQGSLVKKIERFLHKDAEVTGSVLAEDLRVMQRLIAGMVTAVSRAGSQFAKRHLAKFSPSEIAALVRMEPGGVFVSHEVKCWRKYVELAESLDEDAIDVEIRKAVVDYVESLAKGMVR